MQIVEAIIHQLVKSKETQGDGSVQIQPRTSRLASDAFLQSTVKVLLETYSESVSGYGSLGKDANLHRFPVLLGV
jgi:nucleoid-associated protein YejK